MTEKDKEINELRREVARLEKEVKAAYKRGMYEAFYQASEHMKQLLHDVDALLEHVFKNDISYNAFKNLVNRQPTIEAEPIKHGYWEGDGQCSVCKEYPLARYMQNPNYCPNCGAKMDNAPTEKVDTPTENTNRPTNEVEE